MGYLATMTTTKLTTFPTRKAAQQAGEALARHWTALGTPTRLQGIITIPLAEMVETPSGYKPERTTRYYPTLTTTRTPKA